jgi:hypothetical protein
LKEVALAKLAPLAPSEAPDGKTLAIIREQDVADVDVVLIREANP